MMIMTITMALCRYGAIWYDRKSENGWSNKVKRSPEISSFGVWNSCCVLSTVTCFAAAEHLPHAG
jgi:hypothetical protein